MQAKSLDELKCEEWVTVKQFSELTGYATATVYEYCRTGEIETLPRIAGGKVRIPSREVRRFNEQKSQGR